MAKITWVNRTNTGETSKISASIFNDTKTSVNAVYDVIEARLGTTSSDASEDLNISGTLNISGSIIPNTITDQTTSSFNLGSATAAWDELFVSTASINFVEPNGTITKWSKQDVANLKLGKSLRTSDNKQVVNEVDDTTYVRMSAAGKAFHYASNKTLIKLQTSSFELGDTTVPAQILGSSVGITGSTTISGSSIFTTTDLLTLLGNFGQTGSFTVSGSSDFTGDVNMDGAVTTQDLLTVVAGINTTGSVDISGSTVQTGSINHQGSTNTLPPPVVVTEEPGTNTLFYGYIFSGGASPDTNYVQALNYFPNQINYFRFSTSSQAGYNDIFNSSNQDTFFTAVSASASLGSFTDITFTPTSAYPNHFYKFKATSVVDSGSFYQLNVSFLNSGSLSSSLPAPSTIEQSGGGANGRFKFITLPAEADEPTGGFVVGDLLDVLAGYGAVDVPEGSLGDINLDGQVNVNDLLMVLSGFSNPAAVSNDIIYYSNTNNQLIGPVISIFEGYTITIQDNAFLTIT